MCACNLKSCKIASAVSAKRVSHNCQFHDFSKNRVAFFVKNERYSDSNRKSVRLRAIRKPSRSIADHPIVSQSRQLCVCRSLSFCVKRAHSSQSVGFLACFFVKFSGECVHNSVKRAPFAPQTHKFLGEVHAFLPLKREVPCGTE